MIEAPDQTKIPSPKLEARVVDKNRYDEALSLGLDPFMAKLVSSRGLPPEFKLKQWLEPSLAQLDSPSTMADISVATQRIVTAITNGEIIGIETDHDCDGQTSHAVIYQALTQWFGHPKDKIRSYIGHRMQEGYGLSEPLAARILADECKPSVVITADNGSSDEPRIKLLKEHSIDVIVTDHHAIPESGIPQSAVAVLNPTREDCDYPDSLIAGCMVAWLLMAASRTALIQQQVIDLKTPSLAALLDFVAVGTIADCVSLSRSINNRIVTRFGMRLISKFQRPCWAAIANEVTQTISSEDIGFKIGPLLNSDGRLECAFGSVSFLLSEDVQEATQWVKQLSQTNQKRKAIQKQLTDTAVTEALEINTPSKKTLSVYLADGHAGVHGISASRLRETFGKPCFIFSHKQNAKDLISGSGRSTDDCHLRDALAAMHEQHPDLFVAFGGHSGAAGVTIRLKDFDRFSQSFEQAVHQQIGYTLEPIILTDGPLETILSVEQYETIMRKLEPFGREFDAPIFELEGYCRELKWIGKTPIHLSFSLDTSLGQLPCVWFNARRDEWEVIDLEPNSHAKVAFSLQVDTFRYPPKLKCFVKAAIVSS